jgi:bifunctional DNase/RNase
MAKLIEVKIDSLRVSLTNQQRIVVLKEIKGDRYLPVWIGPFEAESITIALQEIEVSRPQTHDLLKNVITALNAQLTKVVISSLKDDIFYGTLLLESDGEYLEVDARPSDAIAIAVRAHIPIFVNSRVMDEAGIIPEVIEEKDEETESEVPFPDENPPAAPINEDRLSIFEEYLKKKGDQDQGDDQPAESDDELPSPQ